MENVMVPAELEKRLLSTKNITGIPVEDLLREAITTWCDCMMLDHWLENGVLDQESLERGRIPACG